MPKRKRKNRHRQQQQHKRRRPRYRCWIEECPETHSAGNKEAVDVHLLITRVLLDDDDGDADDGDNDADNDADNDGGVVVVDADKNVNIDDADADINVDDDDDDIDADNVDNNVDNNVDIDAVKHDCSVKVPDMKPAPDNTTTTTAATIATTNTTTTTTTTPHISVQRHPLARQKVIPKHPHQPNFHHLPRGDCGDGILNPYASDVVHDKYWAQRHRLFRRFADGIQMDPQSWYSVTPEAIANHIAKKMTRNLSNLVILDAFAGVGGNAIAFARRPEVDLVVCVDTDVQKLYMAANNCRVYGIATRKLLFVCADAVDILRLYGPGGGDNVAADDNGADDNGADDNGADDNGADDNGADDNGADDKDADNGNVNPPNHNLSRNIQHNAQHTHGYTFVPFLASPTSTTSSTTTSSTTTTFDILPKTVHAIFLSPPWGGSDYCNQRHFDPINDIQINDQTNGSDLLKLAVRALSKSWSKTSMKNRTPNHSTTSFVPNLAYFLPRNTNGWRLGQCIFDAALHSVEMEQNYLNQKLKTITAYLHAR